MDNFWTDALVKEYMGLITSIEYLRLITSVEGNEYWQQDITKFKKSKQSLWEEVLEEKLRDNQFILKPSLELTPEYIHKEQRFKEISAAIKRYEEAGTKIPNEWINEKFKLSIYLLKMKNMQPLFTQEDLDKAAEQAFSAARVTLYPDVLNEKVFKYQSYFDYK